MGAGLLQPGHLIIILVIALIIFGPGKLPELGSALGQGIREFKRSVDNPGREPSPPQASGALAPPAAAPGTAASATNALPCPSCQAAMPTSARVCTSCGHQLVQA